MVSTLVLFGTYAAVQPGDSRVFQSLFGTRYYLSPVTPAPDCTVRTRRTARTNNVLDWGPKRVSRRTSKAHQNVQENGQEGAQGRRVGYKRMDGKGNENGDDGRDATG